MTSQSEQPGQESRSIPLNGDGVAASKVEAAVVNHLDLTSFTQQSVLENIERLREELRNEIKEYDKKDVAENLQSEIAELVVLLQRTERLVLKVDKKSQSKLGELNNHVCSLRVAITSLSQKRPNMKLAEKIRIDVEQAVVRKENWLIFAFLINRFAYAWRSPSTPLKVIYGLICSFFVIFGGLSAFAISQYLSKPNIQGIKSLISEKKESINKLESEKNRVWNEKEKVLNKGVDQLGNPEESSKLADFKLADLRRQQAEIGRHVRSLEENKESLPVQLEKLKTLDQVLWVAAAGTLGSIVSILIRVVEEFQDEKYRDKLTPFFIGFFKPVIGASFGVLFLAFVSSGIITNPLSGTSSEKPTESSNDLSHQEKRLTFSLIAIAFIVGFSERLAKDTITRFEGANGQKSDVPRIIVIRGSKRKNTPSEP